MVFLTGLFRFVFFISTIVQGYPLLGAAQFDINKVAAIKILPLSPDASRSTTSSSSSSLGSNRRLYANQNGTDSSYGEGTMFTYLTEEEFKKRNTDNSVQERMKSICQYNAQFNGTSGRKNVLLVKMRIKAALATSEKSETQDHDYILGVFCSGAREEVKCGEIRNLANVNKDLPEDLKLELESRRVLEMLNGDSVLRKLIKESSLEEDNVGGQIGIDHVRTILSTPLYKPHAIYTWRTEVGNKKLLAAFNLGTLENLKTEIEDRLGLGEKNKTEQTEIDAAEEYLQKLRFIRRIFKRPCYKKEKNEEPCFGNNRANELYFNQSEQAFITWLKKAGNYGSTVVDTEHCYSLNPLLKDNKYRVLKIDFELYSYLDICHFCRGTISRMLENNKLKEAVLNFFNHLKRNEKEQDRVTFDKECGIEIVAFSYENTLI